MRNVVFVGLVINHHSLYEYLLTQLVEQYDEVCFITQTNIQKGVSIKDSKIKVIIDDEIRIDKIFKKHIDIINQFDILITDEYFGLFFRMRGISFINRKKIMIVHNVNKWTSFFVNPFKYSKVFIDNLFKKHLVQQFDAFITMGPNIQKYYRTKKNKYPIFFIPFDVSKKIDLSDKSDNKIRILIPGMISDKRRNYSELLPEIEKYYKANPGSKILFRFLGRIASPEDEFVADYSKRINKIFGNRIKYWTSFIENDEFEKEIVKSDFILSNIHPTSFKMGIKENVGTSKETGISFIIYKYAKPGIVPDFQNILSGFDNQLIRFESYKKISKIFQKIDHKEYHIKSLNNEAFNNWKQFNELIEKETEIFIQHITK